MIPSDDTEPDGAVTGVVVPRPDPFGRPAGRSDDIDPVDGRTRAP
jgi:hypothetical protein